MEELIWKYIDDDCTKEEVQKIKLLLDTDPDFRNSYQVLKNLDFNLSKSANIQMSQTFKKKLEYSMYKELQTVQELKISDVLSVKWILILVCVSIGIMWYALIFNTDQSSYISYLPALNSKLINMITMVTTGFVMLFLVDWALKSYQRKKISFLML
ncbi:MAG: hypothetical protein IPL55_11645 [Saprospiraceae bacterium]|jgi:uncharacterized protein YktA (UPF0223 family)|nr:hypothetical protein [Saprospiraceae bacterium]